MCGERVYRLQRDGTVIEDRSGSPRLFLHAAELGFRHPVTGEEVRWEMPLAGRTGGHAPAPAEADGRVDMPIEIQWHDHDPQTGEKRFLRAEKFGGQWHFKWR